MHYIMTAFSILAIVVAWKYMWQRTLLDTTRDKLFDLRDDAREWFLNNGYSLDNSVYRALRGMINCHLLHTEKVSLTSYMAYSVTKQLFHEQESLLEKQIEAEFATDDKNIEEYASRVRVSAGFVLIDHIVKNNLFLLVVCYVAAGLCAVWFFLIDLIKTATLKGSFGKRFHPALASVLVAFFSFVSPGLISNMRMEKYSLSQTASQNPSAFVHKCKHCS